MSLRKDPILILYLSILLCTQFSPNNGVEASGQDAAAGGVAAAETVNAAPADVDSLVNAGKMEEALDAVDLMLREDPASMDLARKKFDILWSLERYEECLALLNLIPPGVPLEVRKSVINGKRLVLFELVRAAVKKSDIGGAIGWLGQLADSGYRGYYDLNRDEFFKPLWNLPNFKELQKKIEENAGIGKPAPDFVVELPGGRVFRLSEQKGKVVLVDFWSTFCVPCKKEIPNLKALYRSCHDRGFEIISISLDTDKDILAEYLDENPVPWQTVFSGKGFSDDAASLYEVAWVPSYWLIDRNGILRYHDVRGEDMKAAVIRLVEEN